MKKSLVVAAVVVVAAAGITALSSFFIVDQIQQALVLQFGEPRRVVKEPGLKFKTPFIEEVVYFDKRLLNYDPPAEEVILGDGRRLTVDMYTRYRISDPLRFYQTVRTVRSGNDRLRTFMNSASRSVLGKATLDGILSDKRAELMQEIQSTVASRAKTIGLSIEDLRLVRADLPQENTRAILRRMQTERERIAREIRSQGEKESESIKADADRQRTVLLAEARREAQKLRGEGDATVTRILADAYGKDPEFFGFYRTMEAYRQALRQDDTTYVLSPDGAFFGFFKTLDPKVVEATR